MIPILNIKKISVVFFLIYLSATNFLSCNNTPDYDIKKNTFIRLSKIKKNKITELKDYFSNLEIKAKKITSDSRMLSLYKQIKNNHSTKRNSKLILEIDKHFVMKYENFYDILFVNKEGFVFHSIKMESDYKKNLLKKNLANTKLAKQLLKGKKFSFVEYETYAPSGEPAGFFIAPINNKNGNKGWFILQFSLNQLNTMLSKHGRFGNTGEIYLVNKQRLMLSNSRFIEDSTSLKLKVNTTSVRNACANKTGEGIINDYRNKKVFTSFEKIKLFNTTWIIIVEIDQSEIITNFYKSNKQHLFNKITKLTQINSITQSCNNYSNLPTDKVDMKEIIKIKKTKSAYTMGIANCTGLGIIYPEKFGYLAHITPSDSIYNKNSFFNISSKDKEDNFLNEIIKRITTFNTTQSMLKNINIIIAAPHSNSFINAVDTILENGLELANIKIMYNPKATYGNLYIDMSRNNSCIEWYSDYKKTFQLSSDTPNLEQVVKKIINYN